MENRGYEVDAKWESLARNKKSRHTNFAEYFGKNGKAKFTGPVSHKILKSLPSEEKHLYLIDCKEQMDTMFEIFAYHGCPFKSSSLSVFSFFCDAIIIRKFHE